MDGVSRIERALDGALDTRSIRVGRGVLDLVPEVLAQDELLARVGRVVVISDENTHAVAGEHVLRVLQRARIGRESPMVLPATPRVYADDSTVERVTAFIRRTNALPIAVGSGTINDVVKVASHRARRPYICVATAASMDGYTAFGASIAVEGYKQTVPCPAPRAVIADTEVIAAAPRELAASGYADILGKITAGSDWLIADSLGVEAVDERSWSLVQDGVGKWIGSPEAIGRGSTVAIEGLMEGILITGLAMQRYQGSRPASGSEHQFSHLWEMEHLSHGGMWVSHGFKVGIGSVAMAALYQELMKYDFSVFDIDKRLASWPTKDDIAREIRAHHTLPVLRRRGIEESWAKHTDPAGARRRLNRLRERWPSLQRRIGERMLSPVEVASRLRRVGCPSAPADIGVDRMRFRRSFFGAQHIRRRYTALDLAVDTGVMNECLERLFATGGVFPEV